MMRYLIALLLLAACGGAERPANELREHTFTWSWRVVDGGAPDPRTAPTISCRTAGVVEVGLALRDAKGGITPFTWPCTSPGQATTPPVPDGRYTVGAAALDADEQALANLAPFEADNLGHDEDLGLVVFPVTP